MAELSRGQILKNPEILGSGNDGAKIRFLDADENSHVDVKVPNTVGSAYTFTLPDSAGTNNFYLKSDGNGNTSWGAVTGNPGGTTNQLQYNNAGAFAGAAVTTDGSNLYLTSLSEIRFNDSDNSNHVGFAASSVVGGNRLYTLPDTVGSAGQVLKIASSPSPTANSASLIWENDNSGGAGASPGGVDTNVQFNDGGTFGGDAGLTYNKTTDTLSIAGGLNVTGSTTSGGVNVTTGNDYKINATSVLTSTTLGSGVVNSSLTSVGTLVNLTVDNISIADNTISSVGTGDIILDPLTTNPVRIAGGSPIRLFGSTTPNNYAGIAVPASVSDYTITLPSGPPTTANRVLQFATTGTAAFVTNVKTLNFIIDGGGSVITTGVKGNVVLDADYTFNGWTIVSDLSGSIVVDVRRSTFGSFPSTNVDAGTTIVTGALPTLTTARIAENLAITTVDLSARDILEFEVNSATTITRVTVALRLVSR